MAITTLSIPPSFASIRSHREIFLDSLRGSRLEYKRYLGSPLRYAGGKSLAVGYVIEQIPDDVDALVSPFIGGGSVEVACAKDLGMQVTAYDIFDVLVNYWQCQIANPKKLHKMLSEIKPNRKNYDAIKATLKSHWRGDKKLRKWQLAMHYYFNHNLSYGPGFLGWMSKIYEEPARYYRMIEKVRDFSVAQMNVQQGDFVDVIQKHTEDFLYCDPPYFLDGDSKMFRGIYPQRNFPVHHNNFSHEKLRDLLLSHHGGWILSYNDCSTIRKWYQHCEIKEVSWQYTLGQGETRIGYNRINGLNGASSHVKKSHELLIIGKRQ